MRFLAGKFKEMKRTYLRKMILNTTNRGRNILNFFRTFFFIETRGN